MAEQAWQKEVFDVLKEGGVRQIAFVPDAGHAYAIRRPRTIRTSTRSCSPMSRRASALSAGPGSAVSALCC